MTGILLVGLLLVIIFILITMVAPEMLIWGTFAFCIIFLTVVAIVGFNAVMIDPIGSFWFMIDHNPLLIMLDMETNMLATSPFEIGSIPMDMTTRRYISVVTYIFGACMLAVAVWRFGIFDMIGGANDCLAIKEVKKR